ncbi:AarF/UbiB family protein [Jeotgalibacillus sp. ET6]|uniref:ABC1 kinase family protein n=1 Tax=Jeotgalibacillus sp. ET6 TaxID=3037260 RepID=UPI002418285E|nr:AarF/UbiB family protein [Jeotgalibacillus sp. ET6]MDG5473425.1 AarF/UbiB family protein [Jeotgalibacillus sp. ET6]
MFNTKNLAIYRIYKIVWMSTKFFLQIYWFQKRYKGSWNSNVEEKWSRLTGRQAREYKKLALKLEGLMIKLGQFLSTRADIMPKSFINELDGLTDRVPPVPWEKAKRVMESEWNTDTSSIVKSISDVPVASASIGDVYKATLHNGDTVAVKVQRPGIETIIRTDFKAVKIVSWLAQKFTSFGKQIDLNALYREMTTVIGEELNFRQELQNGETFRERFNHQPGISIPFYYTDFTTRRVLVMEWIEGAKINDQNFLQEAQIDRSDLADRLLQLFIEQLLNEGLFHADPHSGNILIKKDGTIVLIDFGMVGLIRNKDAQAVQLAVEGIIFERYDDVIQALESLRFLLPHADKEILTEVIERVVRLYKSNEWQDGDSFLMDRLLEDIQEIVRSQPIQLPSEFAFFGRAISTFTGVIYSIYPDADFIEMARPTVLGWVTGRNEEKDSSKELLKTAQRYFQPLLSTPYKLQETLEEPKRYRRMVQNKHKQEQLLNNWITQRKDIAFITAIPFVGLHGAVWFSEWIIASGTGVLVLAGSWRYMVLSRRIKKELDEEKRS